MKSTTLFVVVGLLAAVVLAACNPGTPVPTTTRPPSATSATAPAAAATGASRPSTAAPAGPTAVAPTAAAANATQAGTNVVVSYSELSPVNMPLWVAMDQGYFEKTGLSVDARYIESSLGVSALLAGDVQFAAMGGSETLSAVLNGADLEVLACFSPVYPYKLEVQPSIKTAADLKGKKVGVSRFGSSSDTATRAALRQLGLNPDTDVTIIQVGNLAARTAALINGSIDGAVDGLPDTLLLESHGLHPLLDMAAQQLPAVNNVLVARKSWVSAHKDITQAYVDGVVEGMAKAKADKQLSMKLMQQYLQDRSGDATQMSATYDYVVGEVMQIPPVTRSKQFKDSQAQLASKNPQASDFDIRTIIDNSFVNNAIARGLGKMS